MLTAGHSRPSTRPMPWPVRPAPAAVHTAAAEPVIARIAQMLALVEQRLPLRRHLVHAGDRLFQVGDRFGCLHVLNSGMFKTLNTAADGREQVLGLHFRGDWLGFDGIAAGEHVCDAVAMDTGEVWSMRYDESIAVCLRHPEVLALLHVAMSREIGRDRDSLLSLCSLSADARVADFLRYWAQSLAERGLRTDQIRLRMTRYEIGNYLGMTLETVSRALSRLARAGVIAFSAQGRRDIHIPDIGGLVDFIQRSQGASPTSLQ